MNNELEVFKNEEFGEVRTINENGKVMFCGSDIARALGYAKPNNAIKSHCKGSTLKQGIVTKQGNMSDMSFITEGDVYRLITHSKLPSAEKFERWVFDDVLPSIRKHGVYAVDELLNNPDFAIKALTELKNERAEKEKLQITIEEQKPKVIFADSVTSSNTSILVGEMAKLIKQNGHDIGQNRLFKWLRDNNYLISRKGNDFNMPTQKSMNLGLFEIKETSVTHADGHITVSKTPKVTGKGQVYFINKFREIVC